MFVAKDLVEVLQQRFKLPAFRQGQEEAILHLLNQGSLLCICPTGFGKSLLYQLPACLLDGITLVISPLLALMRDQEQQLKSRFNIVSAAINSDQTEEENYQIRQAIHRKEVKILFVAPEQLDHIERFQFLLDLPINMVVVDEAHCISTWGHDFRPSYRQIVSFVHRVQKKNPQIKLLGLTATADSKTELDIKQQFEMPDRPLHVIRMSMDRSNINLSVVVAESIPKKLIACEQLVRQLEGSGLVYCATRENTELVAEYLQKVGINAAAYHAGFDPEKKRLLQTGFLQDRFKIVAATNALGMGIDKSNLRFIIHFDIPGSITAYYQEVGRCGRDGQQAQGILIYDPADKKIQKHFIDSAQPEVLDFTKVMEEIKRQDTAPNITTIKRLTGLHPTRTTVVVAELVEQGFITKSLSGSSQVYRLADKQGLPDLSRYTNQLEVKMRELENMLFYAETSDVCRMGFLRKRLGDIEPERCGRCNNCAKSSLKIVDEPQRTAEINAWLVQQGVEIAGSKRLDISNGLAILDGKMRSSMFINFMKQRACEGTANFGLSEELMALLIKHLQLLNKQSKISAIIAVPSRTWIARNALLEYLGQTFNIPVFGHLLAWKIIPESRQGELLNNDQRHHNVQKKMTTSFLPQIPKGTILLFDDYTGSGNTLEEAGRVLRKEAGLSHPIVPLTIAAIKWRLGSPGMI